MTVDSLWIQNWFQIYIASEIRNQQKFAISNFIDLNFFPFLFFLGGGDFLISDAILKICRNLQFIKKKKKK